MDSNKKKDIIYNTLKQLILDGKEVELPVFGLSMFPSILPGDVVLIKPLEISKLKLGDVVFFQRGRQLVFHRLVKFNHHHDFYLTKGDGLFRFDEAFSSDQLLAVAVKQSRNNSEIKLLRRQWFNKFMVFVTPLTGYFFFYAARLWQKMIIKNQ